MSATVQAQAWARPPAPPERDPGVTIQSSDACRVQRGANSCSSISEASRASFPTSTHAHCTCASHDGAPRHHVVRLRRSRHHLHGALPRCRGAAAHRRAAAHAHPPTRLVTSRGTGVLFQLGGTCRRGGRCLLVVPVRVIQTRFGFLIAWRLPCFLASSRHWYNVRRGVARWQTFTRRAGVASCNTIGEQHFLLGRRFVLRSRHVSFESTFTHALATGECWRDDAWACRLRQLSIVERGFPIYPSMQNLLQRRYNGQVARRR